MAEEYAKLKAAIARKPKPKPSTVIWIGSDGHVKELDEHGKPRQISHSIDEDLDAEAWHKLGRRSFLGMLAGAAVATGLARVTLEIVDDEPSTWWSAILEAARDRGWPHVEHDTVLVNSELERAHDRAGWWLKTEPRPIVTTSSLQEALDEAWRLCVRQTGSKPDRILVGDAMLAELGVDADELYRQLQERNA